MLVVEDIIDSGLTLSYLVRNLESREPASLEVCALLTKPERREIDVDVRYVGFEIPNRFVIGYGLDFAERYRNLPVCRRSPRRSDAGGRLRMPCERSAIRRRVATTGRPPSYPDRTRLRESLLPQRILPAHRDRPARLAREPDADPEEHASSKTYVLASSQRQIQSDPRTFEEVRLQPEQARDHRDDERATGREDEGHRPLPERPVGARSSRTCSSGRRSSSTRRAPAASRGRR